MCSRSKRKVLKVGILWSERGSVVREGLALALLLMQIRVLNAAKDARLNGCRLLLLTATAADRNGANDNGHGESGVDGLSLIHISEPTRRS